MIRNLARGVQSFTSNAFLVTGERTVLVDVGNEFDIVSAVTEHANGLDAVVLTHTHYDHVGNLPSVVDAFDIDVWGYDTDQDGVGNPLADGESVQLGDHDYRVLHTPGHKNDHVCLHSEGASVLFAGDLVFANGSFGRTDLEEGNRDQLVDSIDRVLETADESLDAMYQGRGQSGGTGRCRTERCGLRYRTAACLCGDNVFGRWRRSASMTLPIDPAMLDSDAIGEKRVTLEMEHERAIEHVRTVFTDAGFGVATEFSPSELLNEKVDADRDPYYVLGACNPNMADRALDATENRIGALFPCNVVIWEESPGVQTVYHISIMRAARLLGLAPDDETMADIVADTGELVDEAFANLDSV